MIKVLVVLFLFFTFQICGQKTITSANNIVVENQMYGKGFLFEYLKGEKLIAGEKCNFKKGSAEQVFCDFFNVRTKEELLTFFKSDNIPKSYSRNDYIEKNNLYFERSKDNFYELDSRYVLTKSPFSKEVYIKYINNNENFPKPVYALFCMEEINGKFYVSDMGQNLDLGLFLISTKSSVINDFLLKKLPKEQSKFLEPYYGDERMNMELLIDDFFNLMKENKNHPLYKLLHDEKYSLF